MSPNNNVNDTNNTSINYDALLKKFLNYKIMN